MRRLVPADYDAAARVLLAPSVAPFMRRVSPGSLARMLGSERYYFLLPDPDVIIIALPFIGETFIVHQAALPKARGSRMLAAGRAAVRWLLSQEGIKVLVGFTPSTNRAAVVMANQAGLSRVGVIPEAYGKCGDAVVTAITRATLSKGPVGGGK